MKWIRRVVALALTPVAMALVLVLIGFLTFNLGDSLRLAFLGMTIFAGGIPASLLVGVPLLALHDRGKSVERWLLLVLTGFAGCATLPISIGVAAAIDRPPGQAWPFVLQLWWPPLALALGISFFLGCAAIPVFRWIDDGLRQALEAAALDSQLRKLSPEERRELGSRMDRDR